MACGVIWWEKVLFECCLNMDPRDFGFQG